MNRMLNLQSLSQSGVGVVVLSAARYALPVRFRVQGAVLECRVPTWSGLGDQVANSGEVTLVAVVDTEPDLAWIFIRGTAAVVPEPDWTGMLPRVGSRMDPNDLYQLIRITPRRIERVDESQGWGCRETVDL